LVLFLGLVLYAYYAPYREGVHLRVYVLKPRGLELNRTYYVTSSTIPIEVENYGTEPARAENITIEVAGENVVRKTLNWTWGDIEPEHSKRVNIPLEVKDESKPFVLVVRVYYNGELHSEDQFP